MKDEGRSPGPPATGFLCATLNRPFSKDFRFFSTQRGLSAWACPLLEKVAAEVRSAGFLCAIIIQ